jgi:eukaryotic-like serine/threonine-protein kinase
VKGYRLLEQISSGHAYDVWDAWSEERSCRVVIRMARERRHRRDLRREGRLLQRLTHPNIVRAYETHRTYVVLETLSGSTLAALLEDGPLDRDDAIEMGRQLCSAVDYLHYQGWLHLDLKPDNLIVDHGRLKVIDLSIAQRPGWIEPGTGTRRWMAPEQQHGGRVSAATDVWAIGAVLREAGLEYPACLRDDPAERPSVGNVLRWLDALPSACPAHPRQAS